MKQIEIYTDGSCLGNPGESGAGIVLVYGDHQREISKFLGHGTNNTAELLAVIYALEALLEPCVVNIYSDSQVTVKCANGEWTSHSNIELWQEYHALAERHEVTLHWIRKDSHPLNRRAHDLANEAISHQTA